MLSDLSQIPSLQVTSVGLELREFSPRDGASHDQTAVKVRPRRVPALLSMPAQGPFSNWLYLES